jgi:hypothetical protein
MKNVVKFVLMFALMLMSVIAFAQRSYVKSGTYVASDTVTITSAGNVSGSYSHVAYDSIKYWIAASDSVALYVDRISMDPSLGTTAKGSWTCIDSLIGTTNNGTTTGYGNLVLSANWHTASRVTAWNYGYRLRFYAAGNAALGGTYKFGWLCK